MKFVAYLKEAIKQASGPAEQYMTEEQKERFRKIKNGRQEQVSADFLSPPIPSDEVVRCVEEWIGTERG